ncbi:unnamed protein product [Musa acuminata subsp. burmannicoides]
MTLQMQKYLLVIMNLWNSFNMHYFFWIPFQLICLACDNRTGQTSFLVAHCVSIMLTVWMSLGLPAKLLIQHKKHMVPVSLPLQECCCFRATRSCGFAVDR